MVESSPRGHLGVPLAHGEDPIDGNGADLDQGVFGHPKTKPELKIQTCPEHPFGWKSIPETETRGSPKSNGLRGIVRFLTPPRASLRGDPMRIRRKHEIFYTSIKILKSLIGVSISISIKLRHLYCVPRLCAYYSSLVS